MLPLQDARTGFGFPFWTLIIIIINIAVFYLELTAVDTDAFIEKYALIPASVNLSDLSSFVPFITSQFLHGGFIHIISNMWFLWIFGDNVEEKLGPIFFPFFYLLFGTAGNLLQYIFITSSNIPMLGASGAIAGVLGAYLAFFPKNKVKTLFFIIFFVTIIEIPASFLLFYWFAIQLFSGAVSISVTSSDVGGVAYFAHIGGFVLGWIIGQLLNRLTPTNSLVGKS